MYDLENKQHFSLRKLSVGLASVLIGISFFSISQTVKADTVADQQASTVTNNVQSSDTQENGNTVESGSSNDNQVNNAKNNVTQVQNKTETKPKQDQTENIQQDSVSKTQEANDSKDLGAEKGIVKTSSLQEHDDQSSQVAETSTQHGTLESGQKTQSFNLSQNSPKLTKKVLTTNLIATPPTTNGGFDEATWGKLDVNNWQGSVQNGIYQLTGYTGDPSHVIVPNEADFEQAGKSTNGLQVGIDRGITRFLSNQRTQTIAFSKTNNQKVKAIGTNWAYAFASGPTGLSKFDGSNWDVSGVTNMHGMFLNSDFSDLTSLADWDTSNVTDMTIMFENRFHMEGSHSKNTISDLTPLKNWNTGKVISMSEMFAGNSDVIDLKPIANWNISNVKSSFNLFAGDSKLNLININNTPLMQGFLKMPHALQGSTFITNNVDLAKAVVNKDLPTFTNTATRTITFYIPHATPEQTIQHIYYKTIAPVQINWPIYTLGGGGFSSGTGSSVVVGSGGVLRNNRGSSSGSSVVIGGHGSSSGTGFHYTLGGGGFSSGAGSSVVIGGHGSSSGGRSSGGNSSSSGTDSFSGSGSSSGIGSFSGGGSASDTDGNVIIRERMRRAFASVGAPVQTGSHGPKIVKTYPLTDVKKSDWQLDTSKQNDDVIIDGAIDFKPVEIIQVNGYKAHLIKELVNPTVTTKDGTDVEILEETANQGDNIYHGVRYEAQDETFTVKYVDQDTGKEIPNTEFTQTGVEGDAIKYSTADTIKKLQDQGYTLVNDGFTNKAGDKLTAQNNDKTYVVTLKKIKPQVKQGTQTFNFVDKATNKTVGTAKVGGDVGKDIPISLKVPDGYKLVEGQKVPTSANIKEEDKPINILVEKINTAKPSIDSLTVKYIDADTGKEIPNTEFNQKGNEGDAITYSTAKTIKDLQSKGYTLVSDDFTNKAGSKLSSENNGKTYVVTLKKVKTTPKVQNGTQTYHFVDKNTGKVLTTNQVKGEVGKNVPISLKVPDGYKLVEGQKVPTSASIKGKDNPINILVEKISKPSEVETPTPAPETPAHTGTPKPADSKGGDKKTQNGTQTFNFVDKATNKTVGTSKVGGEVGKDVAVSLKVPNGYKLVAGQTVPTSATIKDKDTPISILVEKDNNKKPAQQTYQFIDQNGNKVVGTAVVKGNEGDHVPVSLKVPKGYHLVPGQKLPTVADLKATDKPIKILVAKDGTDGNGNADSGINGKSGKPNKGNAGNNNAGNNGNGAGNNAGNGNGGNGVASLPQTGNSKSNAGILAGSALVATMASLGIAYNKKKRNA